MSLSVKTVKRSKPVGAELEAMRAYTPAKSLTTDSLVSCFSVVKSSKHPDLEQLDDSGAPIFDTINLWRKAWKQ